MRNCYILEFFALKQPSMRLRTTMNGKTTILITLLYTGWTHYIDSTSNVDSVSPNSTQRYPRSHEQDNVNDQGGHSGQQDLEIAKVEGPLEHLYVWLTKEHSNSSHSTW